MSQQPIIIIGAGLAGLTAGQALLKRGISTILLEKMKSTRRHAYGITLHAYAYQPLLKMLGIDEATFRRLVAVDADRGSGYINADAVVHTEDLLRSSFRASRERLEHLLREGLNVRWKADVAEVRKQSDGFVLRLEDGQEFSSNLIIAADGPHSIARKSLSPQTALKVLPIVAFNGKRRIKQSVVQELYWPYMKDSTVAELRYQDALFHVSINESVDDLVSISWIYSRLPRGPADALHKPNRPLTEATDIPEEFYSEIGSFKDLPQPFADVFVKEKLRSERVLHWLMRTVLVSLQELQTLARHGIMLIGDSIHAQPIVGGWGANAAIKDGIALAEHLAEHGGAGIADWYQERHSKWIEEVERSEQAAVNIFEKQYSGL